MSNFWNLMAYLVLLLTTSTSLSQINLALCLSCYTRTHCPLHPSNTHRHVLSGIYDLLIISPVSSSLPSKRQERNLHGGRATNDRSNEGLGWRGPKTRYPSKHPGTPSTGPHRNGPAQSHAPSPRIRPPHSHLRDRRAGTLGTWSLKRFGGFGSGLGARARLTPYASKSLPLYRYWIKLTNDRTKKRW